MALKIAVAVDIGATNLRVALVSKQGIILREKIVKTPQEGRDGKVIPKQIISLIKQLLVGLKLQIEGIGISSIGPLDLRKGGIINSPNLSFRFVPLVKPLKTAFSLPLYLLNDCTASVWGEKFFGAGKRIKNLVYITISTGIGGGAIVDNHLLFGQRGNAVEVGHLIIDTKYNFLCGCKKGRGHWESLASGKNIPRFFKTWLKEKKVKAGFKYKTKYKTARDIFEAAKEKDKIALYFVREILGKVNARGISNVIVAYNPKLITLGGAVVLNNQKLILEPIKKYIDHYLEPPEIEVTPLKEDIGLFGAAATVFFPPFNNR